MIDLILAHFVKEEDSDVDLVEFIWSLENSEGIIPHAKAFKEEGNGLFKKGNDELALLKSMITVKYLFSSFEASSLTMSKVCFEGWLL